MRRLCNLRHENECCILHRLSFSHHGVLASNGIVLAIGFGRYAGRKQALQGEKFLLLIYLFHLLTTDWSQGGGASLFVTSLLGWYLLLVQLLDAVGIQAKLPVGDFSRLWESKKKDTD